MPTFSPPPVNLSFRCPYQAPVWRFAHLKFPEDDCSGLGEIEFHYGEGSLEFRLTDDYSVDFYSGGLEFSALNLETTATFEPIFLHDGLEWQLPILNIDGYNLQVEFVSGSKNEIYAELKTAPSAALEFNMFGGVEVTATLENNVILKPLFYTDREVKVELVTFPSVALEVEYQSGNRLEISKLDILSIARLDPTFIVNAGIEFELECKDNQPISIDFEAGYRLEDFELNLDARFSVPYIVGNRVELDIHTQQPIQIDYIVGNRLDFQFASRPAWNIEATFRSGEGCFEFLKFNNTEHLEPLFFHARNYLALGELNVNKGEPLEFRNFWGNSVQWNLSTSQKLPTIYFVGQDNTFEIVTFDEVPTLDFPIGFCIDETNWLATEDSLSITIYNGSYAEIDTLHYKPAERWLLNCYYGVEISPPKKGMLTPLEAIPFMIYFTHQQKMRIENGPWMDVDLTWYSECCEFPAPLWKNKNRIEMWWSEEYGEVYHGVKHRMFYDLSCRPVLPITFEYGNVFELTPYEDMDGEEVYIDNGYEIKWHLITYWDINLVEGNSVPDPNWAHVELLELLDEYKKTQFAGGFVAVPDLCNTIGYRERFVCGNRLEFDLLDITLPIMRSMATEQKLVVSEKITSRFYEGNVLLFQFEPNPCTGYVGNEMYCELHVTYEIRITDEGCLENEYMPMTPEGYPDYESGYVPEAPKEGDTYRHSIRYWTG